MNEKNRFYIYEVFLFIFITLIPIYSFSDRFGLGFLSKGLIMILLFFWIIYKSTYERDYILVNLINPLNILIFIYFSICLFSVFIAEDPGESVSALQNYAFPLIIYIIIASSKFPHRIEAAIKKSLIAGSVLLSFITIYQSYISLTQYGYKTNLVLGNSNYFAIVLAMTLPILFERLGNNNKYYILIFINLIAIVASFSKTSWLISIMIILFNARTLIFKKKNIIIFSFLVLIMILIGTYFIDFLQVNYASNYNRFMGFFTESNSVTTRSILTSVSLSMIRDNFLVGVGIGNYPVKTYEYSYLYTTYTEGSMAHNVFLSNFAELGVLGGIITILILVYPMYKCFKNKAYVYFWMLIATAIYLGSHGSGFEFYYLWILLGIVQNIFRGELSNDYKKG